MFTVASDTIAREVREQDPQRINGRLTWHADTRKYAYFGPRAW